MSAFTNWAKTELDRAGLFSTDSDYDGMLGPAIMKMVEAFDREEHSGMSASIAASAFAKLARWEPLTPLTGEDSEWNEVGPGVLQNNRCSRVFKEGGRSYDIDGKVFREPSGVSFTSRDSRVDVVFPYTPKTEYVDVPGPA